MTDHPAAATVAAADDGGGVLYIVATPIGNLEDITARALRILREADLIAAEDTRVTRKLLSHFDIHTPLTAYHAHSTVERRSALIDKLESGLSIALVTDAGTPGISDPGAEIIAEAIQRGIKVEPIPGPSAVIAALVASGLPAGRFVFEGFLPRARAEYKARLAAVVQETRTVVIYESPHRVGETLADLSKAAGGMRRVCVAREITKKFEEYRRGTLAEVSEFYATTEPRGEYVLVLEGADPTAFPMADEAVAARPEARVRAALERGLSPRDAAREVARETGLARNALYPLALKIAAEA